MRNRDVLAWPEVAVAGVGWLPLDPAGAASGSGAALTRLARATAKVRADLPPPNELRDPSLPEAGSGQRDDGGFHVRIPVVPVLLGLFVLIVVVIAGIPLAKAVRTVRRKRRAVARGVVAAWREARDLLSAHGAPLTAGMTVRDLAGIAVETSIADGLRGLAGQVDIALWSGVGADDGTVAEAWSAVRDIRRGLAARPFTVRIRAVLDPRSLVVR